MYLCVCGSFAKLNLAAKNGIVLKDQEFGIRIRIRSNSIRVNYRCKVNCQQNRSPEAGQQTEFNTLSGRPTI